MFIRPRNLNLSLERPVYEPAKKSADGKLTSLPRRSTQYLGSIKSYLRFSQVPPDLLAKLTPDECEQLRAALLPNEPRGDEALTRLPRELAQAAQELKTLTKIAANPEVLQQLKAHVSAAEKAWTAFFKAAEGAGLRRTPKVPTAPLAPAKKPAGTKAAGAKRGR